MFRRRVLNTIGASCAIRARLPFKGRRTGGAEATRSEGHQMGLPVVWIFAQVMIGGLALGTLLILIRPRDDEAAALYRRESREAWAWLQDRLVVLRMRAKPDPGSRQ